MNRPRPTWILVFQGIGAALVAILGLILFTLAFLVNAARAIFRK